MKFDLKQAVEKGVEQALKECELTIGMTLKEAVEKQIPKKVTNAVCPSCNRIFLFRYKETRKGDYCDECGQALDWSDTE
jgi:rRNA maturation endonuclease Nob1